MTINGVATCPRCQKTHGPTEPCEPTGRATISDWWKVTLHLINDPNPPSLWVVSCQVAQRIQTVLTSESPDTFVTILGVVATPLIVRKEVTVRVSQVSACEIYQDNVAECLVLSDSLL